MNDATEEEEFREEQKEQKNAGFLLG